MLDAQPSFDSNETLESLAAVQLRNGFPWLHFREPLEQDFRQTYWQQAQSRIKGNLWLGTALGFMFLLLDHFVLGSRKDYWLDSALLCVLIPVTAISIFLTHTSFYRRAFAPIAQLLAPVFGVAVVAQAFIGSTSNTAFLPMVVLTVIAIYALTGMLFYAALRSALMVLAAYAIGVWIAPVSLGEAVYNGMLLVFANVIGATICYSLERVNRTNYLEARLLTEMASRDGLTGIYNRRMLDEHLDKVWQQATREKVPTALLLVDIDCFKAYNDYYGHQAGDECLKLVAQTLARCGRRPLDFTARYGGEEFAIVLYNARREYVEELARRIQQSLEALNIKHPASLTAKHVTVSIGAACIVPQPERSHFGFVQLADEALYEAKDSGRNRIVIMDREYADLNTGAFRNRPSAIAG